MDSFAAATTTPAMDSFAVAAVASLSAPGPASDLLSHQGRDAFIPQDAALSDLKLSAHVHRLIRRQLYVRTGLPHQGRN